MRHIKKFEMIVESDTTTRTPNLAKDYDKSLATLKKMKAKIDLLQSEYQEMTKQTKKKYNDTLISYGFVERRERDGNGDYDIKYTLSIPGGTKFSNGEFRLMRNSWHDNKVTLSYKDKDVKDDIRIIELGNLKNIQQLITYLKKDSLKGLESLRKLLISKGASQYNLENFDRKIEELKSNFFTGKKSSKDVKLMRPKEIMDKFKIPNVSYQSIQGKRSSVFDRETYYVADNMNFFKRFKEYYEKYGKPIKISTEKFDSREDDYEYEASYRGEREWSYSIGTKVIISFKDENNRVITLYS